MVTFETSMMRLGAAYLIERLLEASAIVVASGNFSRGQRANLASLINHPSLHVGEVDIVDMNAFRRVVVVHDALEPITDVVKQGRSKLVS